MFSSEVYIKRRAALKGKVDSGILLFLGNRDSSINYADNCYSFRQDSNFLYFFGLDFADIVGIIDIDEGVEMVFGDDLTMDQIVWTGTQPTISEKAQAAGIQKTGNLADLANIIEGAVSQGRDIHYLPPYRGAHLLDIEKLTGTPHNEVGGKASLELIKAVVSLREKKGAEEVEQIDIAIDIANKMQVAAMKGARPGMIEQEVAGIIEGVAVSAGPGLSFPTIFSVHGETLHNHYHNNLMQAGDMAINDSGAESPLHYASDITRTIPIGGKFTERQRPFYELVLASQEAGIEAVKPGVEFIDVHMLSCKVLAEGLVGMGLMKGNADEAVAAGAHALFFQCGLGHMMGLDVHDMEGLGEQYVGYAGTMKKSTMFGLKSLRLGKVLEPGFVVTVEPGVYMIPELIDMWKAEKKFEQFINYSEVEKFKDFGGIRIEDDVLVTESGYVNMSKQIPKQIDEVEALASE